MRNTLAAHEQHIENTDLHEGDVPYGKLVAFFSNT
jgi:hypothetical protein